MSNISDYIYTAINRINNFLPEQIEVTELPLTIQNKIPFGLSGAYDYYLTKIYGTPFIIVGVGNNEEDEISPSILDKQKNVIKDKTDLVPIFVFPKLASYLFHRYTKKNINIIVGNRQLFLPSIFLIAERDKYDFNRVSEKTPILFQLIILYHLEREDINGITMQMLSKKLNTSYATVNRAIRWMIEKNFITLEGNKEKRIIFNNRGKALWESSLQYLSSPIEFIVYTPEITLSEKGLISEQNALAEYTLLNNGPSRVAVSKEEYKHIREKNIHLDKFGEYGIEVWKYDPNLLSDTGVVDKLSLYLILKEYKDERIQIELENMINDILW